jgi:diguanylate cyclase (GGDEF)-like protein
LASLVDESRAGGRSLRLRLVVPLGTVLAVLAVGVGALAIGAGSRAADAELGKRAAVVKGEVQALVDRRGPLRRSKLKRLAQRFDAQVTIMGRGRVIGTREVEPPARTYSYPVRLRDGRRLRLLVTLSRRESSEALRGGALAAIGLAAAGSLLLAALAGLLLDRWVTGPLRGIATFLRRARSGEREGQRTRSGPSEVQAIADEVDAVVSLVDELESVAGTDPLTGLANSRHFHEALAVETKRAERQFAPMGLVFLDFDGFKGINDAYGHVFGDEILREAAARLRVELRATDVLARVGGDEFALLLPNTTAAGVRHVAERACAAVREVAVEGLALDCSGGFACYPSDAPDGKTLLEAADAALYLAKRAGKGHIRHYDAVEMPTPRSAGDRAEVMALLERPDSITTVFQPIVALPTGQIAGYEALARFAEPPKRRPDEWFVLARRCGLAPAIEARAVETALNCPGRPAGTYLSLNLSPLTLSSREVQAALPDDLTEIVIELTEHELASDESVLQADLAVLRERGARIAVDDAGAGYAGLQQVMRVRPDLIKLDRSLIQDVHADPAKLALIATFVRFARHTGAMVCAEGIETEDELKTLADLDVSYGQGYVLARPSAPWAGVEPRMRDTLSRRSFTSVVHRDGIADGPDHADQRLTFVSERLAAATSVEDIDDLLEIIAGELGADVVRLLRWDDAAGVLQSVGDGEDVRLEITRYPTLEAVLMQQESRQVLFEGHGFLEELALLGAAGHRSTLIVPVASQGRVRGVLQAFSAFEGPWNHSRANRARIIANQVGRLLEASAETGRATAAG